MKIRTKLYASTVVLMLTAVAIAVALFFVGRQANQAMAQSRAISEVVRGLFELNVLTGDYLLYHSDRAHTQWYLRYASLERNLSTLPTPEDQDAETLERIRREFSTIRALFAQLVRRHQEQRVLAQTDTQYMETRQRLATQIAGASQSMVVDALVLGAVADRRIVAVKQRVGLIGAVFVTVLCAQLLLTLAIIGQSVIRPLNRLTRGMSLVAAGQLDSRVEIDTADEMGQLASGFNDMTDRLQTFFSKLQVEVQERHSVERRLAEETEELSVMLNSLADGVITTDEHRVVRLINPVAERLTGWTEAAGSGKRLDEVFALLEDSQSQIVVPGFEDHSSPFTRAYHRLRARGGHEHQVSHTESAILDAGGKTVGYVVVFRDVTEQMAVQEESMRIQKLESLGVLAGGIAHDFNNILTAILGSLSLASLDLEPELPAYSLIKEAEKASTRAKKLTQQLLTFSKGGAPVKQQARLDELIRESATFALRGSNITCDFHIDADLWTAEVDTGQISQVVQNLVINAKQAMEDGGLLQIYAKNETIADNTALPLQPGPYASLVVSDQGGGIPKEELDKIFDPYFSTKETGSGLGLAIIHSIIVNHAGHIHVESREGLGTKFTVRIPSTGTTEFQPDLIEDAQPEPPKVGRGKILIMDDERVVARIAGRMLNRLGYQFEVAETGEHAIERYLNARAANQPFDLVILDLTIKGGMGGQEVVHLLEEIDPGVKALVSSGYSNDPIMANFKAHGFRGVIAKPYKFEQLRDTIAQFVAPV